MQQERAVAVPEGTPVRFDQTVQPLLVTRAGVGHLAEDVMGSRLLESEPNDDLLGGGGRWPRDLEGAPGGHSHHAGGEQRDGAGN